MRPDEFVVTDLRGETPSESRDRVRTLTEILERLRYWLKRFSASSHPEIPFTGGAVGYFSYELRAAWENTPAREEPARQAGALETETTWAEFSFYDGVLAYAHESMQ